MNGIHDMGGMQGFGRVIYEHDEPVFHDIWEGRLYGISRMIGHYSIFAPNGMRFALEHIDPAVYLTSSYYERWLLVIEQALIEKGHLSLEALNERTEFFRVNPEASPPRRDDPEALERFINALPLWQSPNRDVDVEPQFSVGDPVKSLNINPSGHTRLPRYVRGKHGAIAKYHGVHDFQDSVPERSGSDPQPVYSVRFEGSELWGESAEQNQSLYVDMWESYLERA